MKVWISKYAMTKGVYEAEASKTAYPDMVKVESAPRYYDVFHGREWHFTRGASVDQANGMKARRIVSLKKQLAKLENMEFNK